MWTLVDTVGLYLLRLQFGIVIFFIIALAAVR